MLSRKLQSPCNEAWLIGEVPLYETLPFFLFFWRGSLGFGIDCAGGILDPRRLDSVWNRESWLSSDSADFRENKREVYVTFRKLVKCRKFNLLKWPWVLARAEYFWCTTEMLLEWLIEGQMLQLFTITLFKVSVKDGLNMAEVFWGNYRN